jgi:carbamoyltransferase
VNILGFAVACPGDDLADTSSCIVCDGQVIAAAQEERFSRRKNDSAVPLASTEFCLQRAGLRLSQVDVLAIPRVPFRTGPDSVYGQIDASFFQRLHEIGAIPRSSLFHKRVIDLAMHAGIRYNWAIDRSVAECLSALQQRYGALPPVRFYHHHRAHAAAAYFTSGFDKSAIATIDYEGELLSSAIWAAEGGRLRLLRAEPYPNSLGKFYTDCTSYLGLGRAAEGKTMGLASYGNGALFSDKVDQLLSKNDKYYYLYAREPNAQILGFPPRTEESILDGPYRHFAAAAQNALEQTVIRIVQSAVEAAKTKDLCLGGGVALNCSLNGKLLESGLLSSVWVFPAACDAGLSVGAALLCAMESGQVCRSRVDDVYWGPEFSHTDCQTALSRFPDAHVQQSNQLSLEIAESLAAGEIVGWFQGRMEIGPRALGNRSILADPRTVTVRDRVNRIKSREMWRPLAPVVLAERAAEFFSSNVHSPFMLFSSQVHLQKREIIPAVVHVDGSARPQTVTRHQNPALYDLISAFSKFTGVPVLLNTSFNRAGEPIVCTPEDAINVFLTTELDVLVLGDLVVRKTHPHSDVSGDAGVLRNPAYMR